jgi:transposase
MNNNIIIFNNLKKEEDKILKLRERGMSYKKLAKQFKVELWAMREFLKRIEGNRVDDIFSELKAHKKNKSNEIQNIENTSNEGDLNGK